MPHNRLGVRHTAETIAKLRVTAIERTPRGANHYAWKGGDPFTQRSKRKSPGYKAWRSEVRRRAGGLCEACMCDRGKGRMHAHHIREFAEAPELRLDPNNGAWLCNNCHNEAHAD